MPDKNEIDRRKQILKELRHKEKEMFEQSLPFSRKIFEELFDYLDEALEEVGCDNTLKLTMEFLSQKSISDTDGLEDWFAENGAACDCEILGNVEPRFD